jgi:hypothetical protein
MVPLITFYNIGAVYNVANNFRLVEGGMTIHAHGEFICVYAFVDCLKHASISFRFPPAFSEWSMRISGDFEETIENEGPSMYEEPDLP